ncbi:MAG TPA: hypothetical protein VJT32_10020 [bacterium]|nr:hypothetical protein [bacterium]
MAGYQYSQGNLRADLPSGLILLDVTGAVPKQLDIINNGGGAGQPSFSLDGKTVAMTQPRWGIFFFDVSQDKFVSLIPKGYATSGESHDAYVDDGYVYCYSKESAVSVFSRATGQRIAAGIDGGSTDGGWRPFKGNILVTTRGGGAPALYRFQNGTVQGVARLYDLNVHGGPSQCTDCAWDDTRNLLYVVAESASWYVLSVDPTTYASTLVATVGLPNWSVSQAICYLPNRQQVWINGDARNAPGGDGLGAVAFDVSNPRAPRQIFVDRFNFGQNGQHNGMASCRGRVYAGCGDQSLRIYDPVALRQTGSVQGLNVNYLDVYQQRYLVVANYWYAKLPDGMYVYDCATPDAPMLVAHSPQSPNFRCRAFTNLGLIANVPLKGVDLYSLR